MNQCQICHIVNYCFGTHRKALLKEHKKCLEHQIKDFCAKTKRLREKRKLDQVVENCDKEIDKRTSTETSVLDQFYDLYGKIIMSANKIMLMYLVGKESQYSNEDNINVNWEKQELRTYIFIFLNSVEDMCRGLNNSSLNNEFGVLYG